MIRKILREIRSPEDFTSALALLKKVGPDTAPTDQEWAALLALYMKHMPDEFSTDGQDFVKLCLAADAMMVMPQAEKERFSALGLGPDDLDALFYIRKISSEQEDISVSQTQDIMELAGRNTLLAPTKTILARAALDAMLCSRHYPKMQEQIVVLAEYLSGCGADELDRCTELLEEVRMKCRR